VLCEYNWHKTCPLIFTLNSPLPREIFFLEFSAKKFRVVCISIAKKLCVARNQAQDLIDSLGTEDLKLTGTGADNL